MARLQIKEKTDRFLEVRDPAKAVGLWSHHAQFETTLHLVGSTRQTLGRFFNSDLVRFETHAEALEMMAAKGWDKTASRKLKEYAAQYLGERFDPDGNSEWPPVPRWFRAWYNFAKWLENAKTAKPYRDVRLSFGYAVTGSNCDELSHRTSRLVFLKKGGRGFVAVMMKDGWYGWDIIEKTAYQADPYERLIFSSTHGISWQTVDADIIDELVSRKQMCLFEMEKDDFFDALTGSENAAERFARISRSFEFYGHDPNGPEERFYMTWSAIFNATKTRYSSCDKTNVRLVEVMRERGKNWIDRQIKISSADEITDAARWVVENNGCIVLPPDFSDELRLQVMRSLFYITFPGRKIDEPGGLLCGYQLPGRMVQYATGIIRYDGKEEMIERAAERSREAAERKRGIVVDTLLGRAARVVAERNGLTAEDALSRIELAGGREIIETAAWRWGFMEGNALSLFSPTPQAGSLKLPDLSLAIGFEHRLGLKGEQATVGKLVQTAKIAPLKDSLDAVRYCKTVRIAAKRMFKPKTGAEQDTVSYASESVRIVYDEGRYYLLAIPKFAIYQYERDFLYEPNGKSVPIKAYRSVSKDGVRSRHDNRIELEELDFNKVNRLAQEGRVYLYALDVGADRWLFDATYSLANKSPCWFVPTTPQLFMPESEKTSYHTQRQSGAYILTDIPAKTDKVELRMMFVANPFVKRDGRKYQGRSWMSYCDAYPEESAREQIYWPTGVATETSLKDATRRVVATDGVLMTDDEHLEAAIEGMSYVVSQTADPYAPGGVYHGYMIADRVFKDTDGRAEWRAATGKERKSSAESAAKEAQQRKEKSGKPLVEILSPAVAQTAESEFAQLIEAETLTDKKTAQFFTLESPIVIGEEFAEMVAREFRRIAYTGTMGWRRQIVRPGREVALGIWLARLKPEAVRETSPQTRNKAPVRPPVKPKVAQPTPEQARRLAQLDALLAEELVTQEEYAAKRREILGEG